MRGTHLTPVCAVALAFCACTSNSSAPGNCGEAQDGGEPAPFCYTLPNGFSPRGEPLKRKGWVASTFASEDKAQVTFIARDLDGADKAWKALQGNAAASKAADVKEEEFAGGKGKILTFTTPEKEPRVVISAMLRGVKNAIECEAEYRVSSPKPELLDACKSIREP